MKRKYICPKVTIFNCCIDAHLLAGSNKEPQSQLADEEKKDMEKETGDVDLCAKGFNARTAWDE